MDDIRLKPCPFCGGQPMMLVTMDCLDRIVKIHCSRCGASSSGLAFDHWRTLGSGLPDLATARRHAAAAWNERTETHD